MEIKGGYVYTNYFKSGDTWTNNWFNSHGTGTKTEKRNLNRTHFDY